MDFHQGEDRTAGALLRDCCTESILKVRIVRLSTSLGPLHRMDSQGEDRTGGALFRTAAQNGFSTDPNTDPHSTILVKNSIFLYGKDLA
jgi:hypothetical protein